MTTAQTNHYSDLSAEYLRKARTHLAEGDLTQASEKGWGAAATALKAVAEEREMDHHRHRDLWRIVRTLVRETGDADIRGAFSRAESLHANFYEAWMEHEDVEDNLAHVERLVEKLAALA